MAQDPDDGRSEDDSLEADERLDEDQSDEEVVDEFMERRDLEDEAGWIEDGEKYRCPECEAVHEERAAECRVCGWSAE